MKTTESNTVTNRLVATEDETPESLALTRLDSWKAIASYLNRNMRTVQRWEMLEAMPVYRHCHDTGHSVYAYTQEIDAWRSNRSQKRRPTLRVSAIQRTPPDSFVPAEQAALLRLLAVLVEHLREDATRSTAGLPADDGLRPGAVTDGLVVAEDPNVPRPAEHMTKDGTVRRPLFVACRSLKVDQ